VQAGPGDGDPGLVGQVVIQADGEQFGRVILLGLTAASGIAAPVGGALARRIPLRLQLCVGLLLVTAAPSAWPRSEHAPHPRAWHPGSALAGTGVGISLTGGSQAVVGSAPPAHAGIATGIPQTSLNIGGALATAILGSVMVRQGMTSGTGSSC
jgi:MFS transporter, DHA2 family, multidrug resistance protein